MYLCGRVSRVLRLSQCTQSTSQVAILPNTPLPFENAVHSVLDTIGRQNLSRDRIPCAITVPCASEVKKLRQRPAQGMQTRFGVDSLAACSIIGQFPLSEKPRAGE